MNKYFKRSEIECKCGCGTDTIDYEVMRIVTDVRSHFGRPVTITSGVRCAIHNKSVGGSIKSQHLLGRALDIQVKGVPTSRVYNYLNKKYPTSLGLGLYDTLGFVHVDTRDGHARWNG